MIKQFTVKNFKSIKDEACLDMRAASIHEHDESLMISPKGERYLPVSVIYGPNGGGKSNMIGALKAFIARVTSCYDPILQARNDESGSDEIEPYAFARETLDLPTEFDVDFRTSYTDYRYSVAFHDGKVVYEFLDYVKPESSRPNAIFERSEGHIEMKGCFSKIK